jgi:predicted helicase
VPGFSDLFERFEPDPNVRGRQFEHICKWYLTHDPAYRRKLRQVWLWDEWPGRKGPDTGIDLVAENRQGHLWAIQAKAYSPDHTVTKRDIDTFLSASSTPQFSFRLLIATTARIGANARRTVEDQEKPVHLHMLTDLQHAEIEWPADPSDLRIHDLRHTAASFMIYEGAHMELIRQQLGHSSVIVTQRYAHLYPSQGEDLAARLDSRKRSTIDRAVGL